MYEFLTSHASAVFGLIGALLGGVGSFLAAWAMKNREYSLKVWAMILEKRIKAHEQLIEAAIELRYMAPLGGFEEDGEVARAPHVMASAEAFEDWLRRFGELTHKRSTWLTTKARREVNFIQDYLVTLHLNLASVPSENYFKVGQLIRNDFIDASSNLEKVAFDFFENDIGKRKLNRLSDWHKYPRPETERRLSSTNLIKKWEQIKSLEH